MNIFKWFKRKPANRSVIVLEHSLGNVVITVDSGSAELTSYISNSIKGRFKPSPFIHENENEMNDAQIDAWMRSFDYIKKRY